MILASIKMANTVKGKSLVLFSICAVPFFFFLPFSVLEIEPLYLQIPDYPGHYVDQAGRKLTDICPLRLQSAGVKGMHHHALSNLFFDNSESLTGKLETQMLQ